MEQKVLSFISRFTNDGKYQEVIKIFTCGACYWFAKILYERFKQYEWDANVAIVYDAPVNHFGCRIDGHIYDITGDCTDQYDWKRWPTFDDISWERRIVRDCILFEEVDE